MKKNKIHLRRVHKKASLLTRIPVFLSKILVLHSLTYLRWWGMENNIEPLTFWRYQDRDKNRNKFSSLSCLLTSCMADAKKCDRWNYFYGCQLKFFSCLFSLIKYFYFFKKKNQFLLALCFSHIYEFNPSVADFTKVF